MARGSAFWRWRHTRPFWGGLLVLLAGSEIFLTVKAPLPVVVHVGMQGFIGYLLPIIITLLGVLLIFHPQQRVFYSLLAAVLTLATWVTSNLGGFVFGLLLGLVGSALAFAWSPDKHKPADDRHGPAEGEAEPAEPVQRDTVDLTAARAEADAEEDQSETSTPGVQPDTSHSRPRHRRPSPGLLSGE